MYRFSESRISYRPFLIYNVYVISEKNPQRAWWQHHQSKMPMARMSATKYTFYSPFSRYMISMARAGGGTCSKRNINYLLD
jgi:hypothetical protein